MLTSRDAVMRAVAEFDRLGRNAFLKMHRFGLAREYFLELGGRSYDSTAIVGVAFGLQFPERGTLRAADFSGGFATVKRKLEELGFVVTRRR